MSGALSYKDCAGFTGQKGLIRKQFIWAENGIAGGVYQWDTLADAKAFYQGPWLDGILSRYGVYPEIEYFTTFAIMQNPGGEVIYTEPAGRRSCKGGRGLNAQSGPG